MHHFLLMGLNDPNCWLLYFWHLQKAYKRFWKKDCRDRGTLFFFKTLLRLTNVNGNVKSNYKAHEELFLLVGEMYLMEQVMELYAMETHESQPAGIPHNIAELSAEEKRTIADRTLLHILHHFQYAEFSLQAVRPCENNPPPGERVRIDHVVIGQTASGHLVVQEREIPVQPDFVMSHATNLCMWALHHMHLNDMAKEGDFNRAVLASKLNIPFFFSHSPLSKYYVENIDFLLKTQQISSPQMKYRLLEDSFVNERGGIGNNVETDLAMEHSVRNKKDLIRSLGANKTEQAIIRITLAADIVAEITKNFNNLIGVVTKSGRHTKHVSVEDRNKVKRVLRALRPFRFTSGRAYQAMPAMQSSPFTEINVQHMATSMRRVITRLCRGQIIPVDEDED